MQYIDRPVSRLSGKRAFTLQRNGPDGGGAEPASGDGGRNNRRQDKIHINENIIVLIKYNIDICIKMI